jgi:pSer/pThr/pTyr-binding forkhead associated (FHA) protein
MEPIAFDLGSGINTVGRADGNLIQIRDESISSRHCEIVINENGVFVRDLDSTNGSFIDDAPITGAWLSPGQSLQLGNLKLRLESEEIAIRVPSVGSTAEPAREMVTLEDGSLACSRNPALPANFTCTKCNLPFHGSNLRQVRLSGGKSVMVFCPDCGGKCEVIPGAVGKNSARKQNFLSRFTQTLHLGWKRK